MQNYQKNHHYDLLLYVHVLFLWGNNVKETIFRFQNDGNSLDLREQICCPFRAAPLAGGAEGLREFSGGCSQEKKVKLKED